MCSAAWWTAPTGPWARSSSGPTTTARPPCRDMADPHNGQPAGSPFWQPAHMSEFQSMPINEDNGGVHVNSGIVNRAFYLVANTLGRDKAGRIYFRAWNHYFTSSTDFQAARPLVEQAAIDLYGNNSTEHKAVRSAFDTVGITSGGRAGGRLHPLLPAGGEFRPLRQDVHLRPLDHQHGGRRRPLHPEPVRLAGRLGRFHGQPRRWPPTPWRGGP